MFSRRAVPLGLAALAAMLLAAIAAAPAVAASPQATTFNPIHVTDDGAVLRGQVDPNGLATSFHFKHGTTTAYGASAPEPEGELAGSGAQQVYVAIVGLQPNTTYHARLFAANGDGGAEGADVEFTTRAAFAPEGSRAWEMMTPPFKALPSSFAGNTEGGGILNNPNPGVPSLDGEAMMWANSIFPLSDETDSPNSGDMRLMRRTADGWTFETRNTLPLQNACGSCQPGESISLSLERVYNAASSGDMGTLAPFIGGGQLPFFIAGEGALAANRLYTRRDGTGDEGWTAWLTDPIAATGSNEQIYVLNTADAVRFNDDGSAQARSFYYRGLADDPDTALDEDPSDDQQLGQPFEGKGGSTVYVQRAETPQQMPGAPKELVSACTGTGGDATEIPARVGTGVATDTIGAHSCEEAGAPEATGSATRTNGSATLTGVSTASGAFQAGQIISGQGIVPGTRIAGVGAGTLTLEKQVQCGAAAGIGGHTIGQPYLFNISLTCGELAVGQKITVVGTGANNGKLAFNGATILAIENKGTKLTLSANAAFSDSNGPFTVDGSASMPVEADQLAVTSQRGAVLGDFLATGGGSSEWVTATAMSEDGRRVFFRSPSAQNSAEGVPSSGCTDAVGVLSVCVPQLFVRQLDENGEPTVRWISRAQGVGAQQVAELGRGAHFEGASRDGRHVYFKTNSPLLPTDPNGGESITTGAASNESFDLYRYELPADLSEDPANGTLTRISGGPSGVADPATNVSVGGGGFDLQLGGGSALRYLSDDGELAYFVTTSPIAGADTTPAGNAVTAPGGAVGNGTNTSGTRNLYLFDDTGASPQWRYIATLPFAYFKGTSTDPAVPRANLDACASSGEMIANLGTPQPTGADLMAPSAGNCFRGTPDGKHVLFATTAPLTGDDTDEASDIYLYDYERDELTRVTAPPSGAAPYPCGGTNAGGSSLADGACNGDLGLSLHGGGTVLATPGFGAAGSLANARGWAGGRNYNIAEDANGAVSVYFGSKSNLVAVDTDSEGRNDVYRWREGELTLMTPEFPELPFWYSGSSLDGQDLFVNTPARVDPREIDELDYDIYDLRIGGGFPYQPPPEPCDPLAGECREDARVAPPVPGAATDGFQGAGNVEPKRSCARHGRRAKRLGRAAKRARRSARKVGSRSRARKLRRSSRRFAKQARGLSKKAKKCRRQQRRAGK